LFINVVSMPYKFTFDLSKIPRFVFTEIAKAGYQRGMHKKVGTAADRLIKKFKIQEATGLDLSDAVVLLEDLIDLQARNLLEREKFVQTTKRALFLPHCSRKYMDGRCKATFDPNTPSYTCQHCSSDCLVSKAVTSAQKKGYDVYVVPGGSCVPKIIKSKKYEGVIGVACGEEIHLGGDMLTRMGIAAQAAPLIKNGCADTTFNIESLLRML
jgi:hypothetical protein